MPADGLFAGVFARGWRGRRDATTGRGCRRCSTSRRRSRAPARARDSCPPRRPRPSPPPAAPSSSTPRSSAGRRARRATRSSRWCAPCSARLPEDAAAARAPRSHEPGRARHGVDARRAPRARADARTIAGAAAAACARLAEAHRDRFWSAARCSSRRCPLTFGLKARGLARRRSTRRATQLAAVRDGVLAVQLGGAVGHAGRARRPRPRASRPRWRGGSTWPSPRVPWHTVRVGPPTLACALGVPAGALGQGRARRDAARPDRGRRGARGRRAGARRLLHDAAQAQPGGRGVGARLRRARARAGGHDAHGDGSRSTSGRRAPGRPSGRRSRSCCASWAPRPRGLRDMRRGARGRSRRACAPTSRPRAGSSWRRAWRPRWRAGSVAARPTSWWSRRRGARRKRRGRCATFWRRCPRRPSTSAPRASTRRSRRRRTSGAASELVERALAAHDKTLDGEEPR